MASLTDSAVCLRCWDFSETSQTVSLLTREHGLLRGLAKGAKRANSSFSGGFDPLTSGQIVAILKPSRDLALLTAWHLEKVHRALRQDLAANRASLYMVDLVNRMLTTHDPHPEVFDALEAALARCALKGETARATLVFQWQLLCSCGYRPVLDHDVETGELLDETLDAVGFSSTRGGTVADTGAPDRWRVRPETIRLLRSLDADTSSMAVDDEVVQRANRLLAVYARDLLGEEPAAMRWAFPELSSSSAGT
ncbi:MAG: DNA repair protein RecO [Phycisphaerae bacterium]|nr:DNA repair protein RecO [Phycisphaerae bacterium]